MTKVIQPFHLLLFALVGWLNRHQQAVIDYLIEENRILKDQFEGQRLRFTDEQLIRLAVKAKVIGRRAFDEIEQWVVRMARENIDWSYDRIAGAMANGWTTQILSPRGRLSILTLRD